MSSSGFPTVPFKAVNFHFRGRSMSVTATLVLLSKVCEGASAWEEFMNHLRETFLYYFAHFYFFFKTIKCDHMQKTLLATL